MIDGVLLVPGHLDDGSAVGVAAFAAAATEPIASLVVHRIVFAAGSARAVGGRATRAGVSLAPALVEAGWVSPLVAVADGSPVNAARVRLPLLGSTVLLAAFIGAGISACLQTKGQRRATLRARASEILPARARIRTFGYGDCVELAPGPSCARVVFDLGERDSKRRAEEVRRAAQAHGWEVTRSDDAQGGWSLFLERDGFRAYVVLWRPERYPPVNCRDDGVRDQVCFNTLNLTRG
jgi:hypothetical protein